MTEFNGIGGPWGQALSRLFDIEDSSESSDDPVNHPGHYTWLPSGVEVIDITESLNFCLGNAVKYILRADHKGNPIQDLEKAVWYIKREIGRRESEAA